jgi:hypothetical protein
MQSDASYRAKWTDRLGHEPKDREGRLTAGTVKETNRSVLEKYQTSDCISDI